MNEKFLNLEKEKQIKIINAGLECFGKYGYKKANTEDIAKIANISKGTLFYYFVNKKELYLFLYRFCVKIMIKFIDLDEIKEIDDFFELLNYGTGKKIELIEKYPFILNFIIKAMFSQKEIISEEINKEIVKTISTCFDVFFQYIDKNKFKPGYDPEKIGYMLFWMGEGYLLEKTRFGEFLDINQMINEFNIWVDMFKKMSYKEEYL